MLESSSRLSARYGVSLDHFGMLLSEASLKFVLTCSRFPSMFDNVGVANSAGVVVALLVGVGIIPTVLLQWRGQRWRVKALE